MAKRDGMTTQYGILVDISSCVGCGVCVIACKQENGLPPNIDDAPGKDWPAWQWVLPIGPKGVYPDLSMHYLPVMCMHCEYPPCREACPIPGAIYKREDGVVLVDKDKCDGCKDFVGVPKCIPACPYQVIQFDEKKGIVEFCTLCAHRIDTGLEPACVKTCPTGAMNFGDRDKMVTLANERLAQAKSKFPKAVVTGLDDLRCFYLLADEAGKYYLYASVDSAPSAMDRKMALKKIGTSLKELSKEWNLLHKLVG